MTFPQVRTLSNRRLYQAYKHSGLGIEGFAQRVRDFHPGLAQTSVKQLTRWHVRQKPRQPELVVAAYSAITGKPETFFYTTTDEEEEESRVRRLRELAAAAARGENVADDLLAMAAVYAPASRERVEVGQ